MKSWEHDVCCNFEYKILYLIQFDYLFGSAKQVSLLRKLLTSYSSSTARQTVFASASIPQHNRFLYDCVQHKWTKVLYWHVCVCVCVQVCVVGACSFVCPCLCVSTMIWLSSLVQMNQIKKSENELRSDQPGLVTTVTHGLTKKWFRIVMLCGTPWYVFVYMKFNL